MPSATNRNATIDLRQKIAKEYCRSVLWLDDEIRPDATSTQREMYLNFFVRVGDEFSKKHVLCQLRGFPQILETNDPYADNSAITDCTELAKKTDILILDWHLGESSPVHSKKILSELIKGGGNRFVVILSKEPQLKHQFEREFNDVFQLEGDWYRHKNGPFVLLLQKTSFEEVGSGTALIDKIYEQLAHTYPDYLHWAAIEIAGRIKTLTHSWLSRLPTNTDIAILAERRHSTENIEEAILENLLDDLKETVTLDAVSSLNPDHLTPAQWLRRDECNATLEQDLATIPDSNHKATARTLHPLTAAEALKRDDQKTYTRVLEKHGNLSSIMELKRSVEALGEFSEVVSVPRTDGNVLRPGSVLLPEANDTAKILVCISQGCDCLRATKLLFLQGADASGTSGESGETFLQFNGKRYIFRPKAESLCSFQPGSNRTTVSGWKQIGLLRQSVLARLLSRYWAYSTRVGINQPRLMRDSRREAPL